MSWPSLKTLRRLIPLEDVDHLLQFFGQVDLHRTSGGVEVAAARGAEAGRDGTAQGRCRHFTQWFGSMLQLTPHLLPCCPSRSGRRRRWESSTVARPAPPAPARAGASAATQEPNHCVKTTGSWFATADGSAERYGGTTTGTRQSTESGPSLSTMYSHPSPPWANATGSCRPVTLHVWTR